MEDAGTNYSKGLIYLKVARRILVAARALDDDDREDVRRLADGLVGRGTAMLTNAVKTPRGGSNS